MLNALDELERSRLEHAPYQQLTQEQTDSLRAHLARVIPGGRLACAVCTGTSFEIVHTFSQVGMPRGDHGKLALVGLHTPVIAVTCECCGSRIEFDAVRVGLLTDRERKRPTKPTTFGAPAAEVDRTIGGAKRRHPERQQPQSSGDEIVLVRSPIAFGINLGDGQIVKVLPGIQKMMRKHAMHPYAKDAGLVIQDEASVAGAWAEDMPKAPGQAVSA